MKNTLLKYFLILFLLSTSLSLSQNVSGNVTGLPSSNPLEGVYITVKDNTTGDLLGNDTTNANGDYNIDYIIIGIENELSLPTNYSLSNPYPQPFNPSTKFDFNTPVSGMFNISIYTILGEKVFHEQVVLEAGSHSFILSGLGSAGVYLFNISSNDFYATQKLMLLDGGSGIIRLEHTESSHQVNKRTSITDLLISFQKDGYYNKDSIVTWSMNLMVDAGLQQVTEYHTINLEAFVPMSGYNQPLKYYTARLKTTQGTILQTKQSGNSNSITFTNVASPANYLIEVLGDTASRPNFSSADTTFTLISDTLIQMYPQLYLRPTTLTSLENISFNEDEPPADSLFHDLWLKATGYDSLGNKVPDNQLLFEITNQTNSNLVNVIIYNNRFTKLDSLKKDGNGNSTITVKATSPNLTFNVKNFSVTIFPRTDVKGRLDSLFGAGPIVNALVEYKTASGYTDNQGEYNLQVAPGGSADTLTFTKDGFYQRRLSPFNAVTDITINETIADTSLNMDFVNATSRTSTGGIQRWITQPVWYINTNPPNGGGTITQAEIDTVVSIIINDLPQFTDGFFQNPEIIIGINPPPFGVMDTIRVEWDNTIPGLGEHGEYFQGNILVGGVTKLRTNAGRGVALQELSQNLGPRMDSNIVPSAFNSPAQYNYYTIHDIKLGKLLYNRPPGNRSPDTDP